MSMSVSCLPEPQNEHFELPNAVVSRIVKKALPDNIQIQKEAKVAIAKAAKIWILYATACANDFCLNSNRSTISGNDVLAAMNELEFGHFVEPLKETLQLHKKEQESKKAQRKKDKENDG